MLSGWAQFFIGIGEGEKGAEEDGLGGGCGWAVCSVQHCVASVFGVLKRNIYLFALFRLTSG